MKRFGLIVKGLVAYALVLALVWYGAIQGVEWAGNVLRFYIWALWSLYWLIAVMVLVAAASQKWDDVPEWPKPMPVWISYPVRMAAMFGLAAAGWFFTAAAYVGLIVAQVVVRASIQTAREAAEKRKAAAETETPAAARVGEQ